jgi:nucleotide-binding universal stress UspA family protein
MDTAPLVVGVDGTAAASRAVVWAADEAAARRTGLLVVAAADPSGAVLPDPAVALDCVAALRTRYPDLSLRAVVDRRPAPEALVDRSRTAALVVVGDRGARADARSVLGSVSHRVASAAHCPVVVVPAARAPRPVGAGPGVVLGLAGGRAGAGAARLAVEEARVRGCTLTAVLVAPRSLPPGEADRRLAELVAGYRLRRPGVLLATVAIAGDPGSVLLEWSQQAELLVLGCHHADDPWSVRLGGVPTGIVAAATCPVALAGALPAPA